MANNRNPMKGAADAGAGFAGALRVTRAGEWGSARGWVTGASRPGPQYGDAIRMAGRPIYTGGQVIC
jgi:hypothetical protein